MLDVIERLYNSEQRDETIEYVTKLLLESFSRTEAIVVLASSAKTPRPSMTLAGFESRPVGQIGKSTTGR